MEKQLNILLSDYVSMYHKLQNYHWNIEGKDFFQVHAKLEELYDNFKEAIDEVAEVMLMEGYQPVGSMKDFSELTKIKEANNEHISSKDIFKTIIKDFEYFLKSVKEIKSEADNNNAYNISILMDDYIKNFSKTIWMVSQVLD